MDQELVPDQDMPSDDSFEQAVRDEGDVADTAATEIKTARSKESKKTGGENMGWRGMSTLNRSQGMKYIAMCGRDSSSITFQVPSS